MLINVSFNTRIKVLIVLDIIVINIVTDIKKYFLIYIEKWEDIEI